MRVRRNFHYCERRCLKARLLTGAVEEGEHCTLRWALWNSVRGKLGEKKNRKRAENAEGFRRMFCACLPVIGETGAFFLRKGA